MTSIESHPEQYWAAAGEWGQCRWRWDPFIPVDRR